MKVYVVVAEEQYCEGSVVVAVTTSREDASAAAEKIDQSKTVRVEEWDARTSEHIRDLRREWT